jgi:hypothetical protein
LFLLQVEGLLSDSEAERRTLRAKYMNLGKQHVQQLGCWCVAQWIITSAVGLHSCHPSNCAVGAIQSCVVHATLMLLAGGVARQLLPTLLLNALWLNCTVVFCSCGVGDKLEGMLADEAAQQKAAAADAAALQQQLAQAQQAAATAQQQLEQTAAQLCEAQQALVDADRLHSKAIKKLDKKMVQLAQEYDVSRQELLIKSAEILDLQAQLKEAAGQHEVQLIAAQDQVGESRDLQVSAAAAAALAGTV